MSGAWNSSWVKFWEQPKGPVLQSKELRLRLPNQSDFTSWTKIRIQNQTFLKPFEPKWSQLDLTRKSFANRVRRTQGAAKTGDEFSFFIFLNTGDDETLIGGVTLSNIRYRAARHANIGYWLAQGETGKGYMVRSVALVLNFAFSTLSLQRVHAACMSHNQPSINVLTKSGFVEEGFAKQYLQIDGQYRDHLLFGLTRDKYSSHKSC